MNPITVTINQDINHKWHYSYHDPINKKDFRSSKPIESFANAVEEVKSTAINNLFDFFDCVYDRKPYFDISWSRENVEDMKKAVSYDPFLLAELSPILKNNRDIAKIAVTEDGSVLKYASTKLRQDAELAQLAIESSPSSYLSLPVEFQMNPEFAIRALTKDGSIFDKCRKGIRSNVECAKAAVTSEPWNLKHVDTPLKSDIHICMLAHTVFYKNEKKHAEETWSPAHFIKNPYGEDIKPAYSPLKFASVEIKKEVGDSPMEYYRKYCEIIDLKKNLETVLNEEKSVVAKPAKRLSLKI